MDKKIKNEFCLPFVSVNHVDTHIHILTPEGHPHCPHCPCHSTHGCDCMWIVMHHLFFVFYVLYLIRCGKNKNNIIQTITFCK